jgi:hypothetical protein
VRSTDSAVAEEVKWPFCKSTRTTPSVTVKCSISWNVSRNWNTPPAEKKSPASVCASVKRASRQPRRESRQDERWLGTVQLGGWYVSPRTPPRQSSSAGSSSVTIFRVMVGPTRAKTPGVSQCSSPLTRSRADRRGWCRSPPGPNPARRAQRRPRNALLRTPEQPPLPTSQAGSQRGR